MDDFAASDFRDYVIKGDTAFNADEMKSWGALWIQEDRCWMLYNTNELCSDYQAILDLGLSLYPIQIESKPLTTIEQILRR